MKKITLLIVLSILASTSTLADVGDLLITEVVITPAASEFVEIYNNGATAVDLTDVYLTDATFAGGSIYYYQVVNGAGGGGGFADFHARFPIGASIASGEYQTIALNGSSDFISAYTVNPTYKIFDDGVADGITPMLVAFTGSVDGNESGLSDGGEVLVLYSWDGTTDLVQDLDYVLWGDKVEAVDKTGIAIDGPDGDALTSSYLDDTIINDPVLPSQAVISTSSHASGMSWQRDETLDEGIEFQTGGNGINGSDETSEDLNNTFYEGLPSPNAAGTPPPPSAPNVVINEVDAVGVADFIELKGSPGASLNDITLALYQGSDDTIYKLIDLSGSNIPADGYFVITDSAANPDIGLAGNLNDDASAVAIYFKNISNFNLNDSITDPDFNTDIIDAMVYHSGIADDGGLLALLNMGQAQIDEDSNFVAATESSSRCPDGAGGVLNTGTYKQTPPTAGGTNNQCPIPNVAEYYIGVDATDATTLRTTLHDIIKVALSFDYTTAGNINDTWHILSEADADPLVPGFMVMVYKNNSTEFLGGGQQAYNREHTWPQSRGFSSGTMGGNNAARTDAHHLMMSDVTYNGDRSRKYYDNCDASCTELVTTNTNGTGGGSGTYPGNSNWYNGDSFEAWNERKGDVARAMLYLDVRYEGDQMDPDSSPPQLEPDLTLINDINELNNNPNNPNMGLLSVILQWHSEDPVDQTERDRNDVVFEFQQNRNPFVDHPEWVACIFENSCVPILPDAMFSDGFED
jgi:endonuclease I